jgi:hypothetical protein
MSDLERQIQEWKAGFRSTPYLRPEDVEELEQHVRDALPSLISSGLTEEEAVLIATRRIGAPLALEPEFAKVNGSRLWSQRALWIAAGALLYVVCRLVIGAAGSLTQAMVGVAGGSGGDMLYAGFSVTCAAWLAVALAVYRRANRTAMLPTARPAALAGGAVLLLALAGVVSFVGDIVRLQLIPFPEDRGMFFPYSVMVTRAVPVLVPLLLFTAMLFRTRDSSKLAE